MLLLHMAVNKITEKSHYRRDTTAFPQRIQELPIDYVEQITCYICGKVYSATMPLGYTLNWKKIISKSLASFLLKDPTCFIKKIRCSNPWICEQCQTVLPISSFCYVF